ncbi:hypothetical protein COCC4DRAFT_44459 [Bipolaris maydis ATCC 48331]|uniref:Uncharacterized protein n=2 Tax=Cochliobolus heterostrophus TaxID=5016 RepID=M2UGZ4_COCH5|nr:uncharacterized protein COCC4DRAFT_44459 [Bipolaris maydis ATCC 48331]EMD87242.1 hypothetical protein COCHEDRAFT_1033695 [Bipolaris maydis C5]ENI00363.1 hypothetical protein COCC4DRAFT_44459 [Bipolaris maydis ATCC 48331]KAH7555099.1 hypothetical protein BM1_07760 [Bipolaris maydis]
MLSRQQRVLEVGKNDGIAPGAAVGDEDIDISGGLDIGRDGHMEDNKVAGLPRGYCLLSGASRLIDVSLERDLPDIVDGVGAEQCGYACALSGLESLRGRKRCARCDRDHEDGGEEIFGGVKEHVDVFRMGFALDDVELIDE